MLEVHRTATGQKLLIAEMGDQHLVNTVKLILNGIEQRNKMLVGASGLSEYQAKLYSVEVLDVAAVAKKNRSAIQQLYPYLAELYLRGMDQLVPDVQAAVGRAGQLITAHTQMLESGSHNLSPEQVDELIGSLGAVVDISDR